MAGVRWGRCYPGWSLFETTLCTCVCVCVASLCLLSDLCSYRWSDVSGEGIRTRENDGEEGRGDSGNPTSSFQSG